MSAFPAVGAVAVDLGGERGAERETATSCAGAVPA